VTSSVTGRAWSDAFKLATGVATEQQTQILSGSRTGPARHELFPDPVDAEPGVRLLVIDHIDQVVGGAPDGLRVEHLDEPLGVRAAAPRLSWRLPDGAREQRAYRITTDNG